jgi:SAM-dependent methyltransferase
MAKEKVTRGDGLIEAWLSQQRAKKANRLIPEILRDGRILDIGCGTHPLFLKETRFREKFSLDQIDLPPERAKALGITHATLDLGKDARLPFEDAMFSVVTLLAVIEHFDVSIACAVLREVHRVLLPGGRVVVTTPAAWADKLLLFLARLNIVSPEEIHEHAFTYRPASLGCCLGQAGFTPGQIQCGTFELWMNLWATGEKQAR